MTGTEKRKAKTPRRKSAYQVEKDRVRERVKAASKALQNAKRDARSYGIGKKRRK